MPILKLCTWQFWLKAHILPLWIVSLQFWCVCVFFFCDVYFWYIFLTWSDFHIFRLLLWGTHGSPSRPRWRLALGGAQLDPATPVAQLTVEDLVKLCNALGQLQPAGEKKGRRWCNTYKLKRWPETWFQSWKWSMIHMGLKVNCMLQVITTLLLLYHFIVVTAWCREVSRAGIYSQGFYLFRGQFVFLTYPITFLAWNIMLDTRILSFTLRWSKTTHINWTCIALLKAVPILVGLLF